MKNWLILLTALALSAAGAPAATPDLSSKSGQRAVEERLRAASSNQVMRAALETDLLDALKGAPDESAMLFAAQQLAVVGSDASVDLLVSWLSAPTTTHAACIALGRIPSNRAGDALRAALPSSRGEARVQIIHAISARGDVNAVGLLARLARDPDAAAAATATAALAAIPGKAAREEFEALRAAPGLRLERAATDRDPAAAAKLMAPGSPIHVRRGALNLLLAWDPSGAGDLIERVLRSSDAALKPAAIAAIARLPAGASTKRFAQCLPALPAQEQVWLLAALADRPDAQAQATIRMALDSREPAVRAAAIAAVRRTGDAGALPDLLRALRSADDAGAKDLEDALASLPASPRLDEALITEALTGTGPRARVIRLFARRGTAGIAPVLLALINDSDAAVSKAALDAVGQLATSYDLPGLLACLGRVEGAESAAARTLTRIEDPAEGSHALRDALAKARETQVQAALIRLLGKAPTAESLQVVVSHQQHSDPSVRDAAVRTLADWPRAEAWKPLLAVYTDDQAGTYHALALRGLVRLAAEAGPDTRTRYECLIAGARTDDERRLILGAISGWASPEGLPLLKLLGTNEALRAEVEAARAALTPPDPKAKPLFDGATLQGWEGDTATTWRVEGGSIAAGALDHLTPANQYLATTKEYGDFDLQLRYRLAGTEGFVNGGVQFRSKRLPDPRGMAGYQADLGAGYDGALYDEHRRDKVLARPAESVRAAAVFPDGWNHYRIRAEGPRIRLWLNGVLTVDYTEPDASIPLRGVIAVQIHGGAKSRVEYRDLYLTELGP